MRLFGHRLTVPAAIGMAIVAINIIAAVGAPILAPFPEADVVGDAWADADPTYWLGLDNLGRDIFSRLLKERIIFVGGDGGAVTTDSANNLISQLLYLDSQDPEKMSYEVAEPPVQRSRTVGRMLGMPTV